MRWKAIIPLSVLIVVIVGFNILFLDSLVKKVLINQAQTVTNTKVEIQDLDIQWSPLGVSLTGLSVGHQSKPLLNSVEVQKISFNIQFEPLLRKKFIINTVQVTGVEQNTPRQMSGFLPVNSQSKKESKQHVASISQTESTTKEASTPTFDLSALSQKINLDEIVDPNSLKSTAFSKESQRKISLQKKQVSKTLNLSQSNEQLGTLQTQFSKLTQEDIKSIKSIDNINILKSRYDLMQKDITDIKSSLDKKQSILNKQSRNMRKDLSKIKKLGNVDYNTLINTLDLSQIKTGNMSQTLLSSSLKNKITKYSPIISKLQTLREKNAKKSKTKVKKAPIKGINVAFKNKRQLPSLWIKHIALSSNSKANRLTGEIRNISNDQSITNQETTYELTIDNYSNNGSKLQVKGQLDYRTSPENNTAIIMVSNFPLNNFTVLKNTNNHIQLKESKILFKTSLKIASDTIRGPLNIEATNLLFDSKLENPEDLSFENILSTILSDINETSINGSISGKITSPKLELSSDVDQKLNQAVGKLYKEKITKLKQGIRNEINKHTQEAQNNVNSSIKEFRNQGKKELNKVAQSIGSLEESVNKQKKALIDQQTAITKEIQDKIDAQKQAAKEKLAKIAAEKAKLDAAKKEEEARLKAEAEAEAKKKLKGLKLF